MKQKCFKNLNLIIKLSDAVLIDRGDLSRYVPVYQIPSTIKNFKNCKNLKAPVYIATNLLESMVTKPSPTR